MKRSWRKRVVVLVGAVLLAVPTTAAARERERVGAAVGAPVAGLDRYVPLTGGLPRHVAWARSFAVPIPRAVIHVARCDDGSDVEGCASAETGEVWVRHRADRHTLAHELGHVFDYQRMTDIDRARFTRLLRLPASAPWAEWTGNDCLMNPCPGERFADAYAACALRLRPDRLWMDSYGYEPTVRRHRKVCAAIRKL